MADLNALIARGYQFQPEPDPFAQYAQMQQLDQNRQANQLNRMNMEKAQQGMDETNAMRGLNINDPNYRQKVYGISPTLGAAFDKSQQAAAAQKSTTAKQDAETTKFHLDNSRSLLVGVNNQPGYDAWRANTVRNLPDLGNILPTVFSSEIKNPLLIAAADISKQLTAQPPTPTNLARLQSEMAALPPGDPRRNQYVSAIKKESEPAPVAGSALSRLQSEMAALPPGDPRRSEYMAMIRKETTFAPATVVSIDQKQESSFAAGLGKGQSERLLANQVVAQDAAAMLETNQVGRDLLKSGAITGTGADFFVGLNNALKQAGLDFGYADAASNSQAYTAAMGANVGRIIKQFGAGTGLSDADREYAAQMAGGKIALTEASLRKILDINDRAANRVIDLHNKNVSGVKTNITLTVDKPKFTQPKLGAEQIPTTQGAPASRTVVRTGTLNGRRVIQYSDGSTDYAN